MELGDLHGPGGPLAVVALFGLVKLQNKEGAVTARYGVVARSAFLKSPAQARAIIMAAADLGVNDAHEDRGQEFYAAFSAWKRWQASDPGHAERQRRYRERKDEQEDEYSPAIGR